MTGVNKASCFYPNMGSAKVNVGTAIVFTIAVFCSRTKCICDPMLRACWPVKLFSKIFGCGQNGMLLVLPLILASGIEDVDVLVADVSDQSSIDAMCARASVVIDCVGPVSISWQEW